MHRQEQGVKDRWHAAELTSHLSDSDKGLRTMYPSLEKRSPLLQMGIAVSMLLLAL